MERLIEVRAPVERVFGLFSDPANLPRWVLGGGAVHVIDERRFRWLIKRTNGSWSWEVSVEVFEPPVRLLWRAAPTVRDRQGENGFTLETSFHETKRNTTILRLIYSEGGLSGGTLAAKEAAPTKGAPVDGPQAVITASELDLGLEHFKRFVEHYGAGQEEEEATVTIPAARGVTRPSVVDPSPAAPAASDPPIVNTRSREVDARETLSRSNPSEGQPGWRKSSFLAVLLGLAVLVAFASGVLIWLAREQQQKQDRAAAAEALPAPTVVSGGEPGVAGPFDRVDEPAQSNEARAQQNVALAANTEIGLAEDDQSPELGEALSGWVAATNARDMDALISYYAPKLERYYLRGNFTRDQVLTDKRRLNKLASLESVRVGPPDLSVSPDGRTAQMTFRKEYGVANSKIKRRGEVVQELRWRKTDDGWKITSERDLRVIR